METLKENGYQPAILVEDEVALRQVLDRWNDGQSIAKWDSDALESLHNFLEKTISNWILYPATSRDCFNDNETAMFVYMLAYVSYLIGHNRGTEYGKAIA